MEREGPQFVRRHWTFILGYIVVSSLAVGFLLAAMFILYPDARAPRHHIGSFYLILGGGISVLVFIMQLIGDPLVFPKNVICQTCHRRQTLARIPFFGGRIYKQPKRDECGGDLEPALFWQIKE